MAIASTKVAPVLSATHEEFSLSHSWGVDFSEAAIETFKANLGEDMGIKMDARKFVETELTPEKRINALAFGFPCNSFSQVGKREGLGNEKFGELYKTGISVIEAYSPVWFVAENVSGISKSSDENHDDASWEFVQILKDLSNAGTGYNVVAHLYKFEEYGVPQARHRYVIVGVRHDIAERDKIEFKPPAPQYGPGRLHRFVTCKDALDKVTNTTEWGSCKTRQSETVIARLKFTLPGENAWKLDELVDPKVYADEELDAYLKKIPWYETDIAPKFPIRNLHDRMETVRARIEEVRLHCEKARMSHIYRRLDPTRPAYTLTGSGGGGTHIYHYSEHRALTNEERAALQTFPEDFVFKGSSEEIRRQIGMAVPTKGAKQIFEAVLKTFAKVPYDSVEPDPSLVFRPDIGSKMQKGSDMGLVKTRRLAAMRKQQRAKAGMKPPTPKDKLKRENRRRKP